MHIQRRALLGAVAGGAAAVACGGCDSGAGARQRPPKLTFRNPVHIPPLLRPEAGTGSVRRFTLTMQSGKTRILPGKPTPTFGFNGTYLGPTVRARRGERVE